MYTVGADPELFLQKIDNGKLISAVGKFGGTKENPRRLLGGFCLQEDNVAVEYNIPATSSPDQFIWANQLMVEEIDKLASEFGCKSVIQSSGVFTDDELATPAAQLFGCDPDFNAWELAPNPKPNSDNPNLRSAGGHIHIGMPDASSKDKIELVRTLDLLIGVPLAFLDPTSKRRELYGRAGCCRFKPYGVEYRTPSNIWLSSPLIMDTIFTTIERLVHEKEWMNYANQEETLIQKAINELDEPSFLELRKYFAHWPSSILSKIKLKAQPKVKPGEWAINYKEEQVL